MYVYKCLRFGFLGFVVFWREVSSGERSIFVFVICGEPWQSKHSLGTNCTSTGFVLLKLLILLADPGWGKKLVHVYACHGQESYLHHCRGTRCQGYAPIICPLDGEVACILQHWNVQWVVWCKMHVCLDMYRQHGGWWWKWIYCSCTCYLCIV